MQRKLICHHSDWELYTLAFETSMELFEEVRGFPAEEQNTLTEPLVKSSRALCAALAQAWRKRLEDGFFRAKLDEAEALAAETQSWLEFALRCHYLDAETGDRFIQQYGQILGKLVWLRPVPVEVDR